MASMVPYHFGIRPMTSWLDAFDDLANMANSAVTDAAFPMDVEDAGDAYVVKAYLAGVSRDEIDVELNEGRLSISVNVEDKEEDKDKNWRTRTRTTWPRSSRATAPRAACTSRTPPPRASRLSSPTAC